jgi:hypothetical protein
MTEMEPQRRPRLDREMGSFKTGTSQRRAAGQSRIDGNEIECQLWCVSVRRRCCNKCAKPSAMLSVAAITVGMVKLIQAALRPRGAVIALAKTLTAHTTRLTTVVRTSIAPPRQRLDEEQAG